MSEPQVFHYQNGELHLEQVPLREIADALGTPCYVYSHQYIVERTRALQDAFAATPCTLHYSVKANSNIHILKLFHELGAGFDIVSAGELHRVLAAGGDPADVIFSGVGKRTDELDLALKLKIRCFNVESAGELQRLAERAALLQTRAPVSLRVNPDVDPQTHPYIATGLKESKFGVPIPEAVALYKEAHNNPNLEVVGIDCHIGSQLTQLEPLLEALTHLLALTDELAAEGIHIEHLDLGGGMGIRYQDETPLDFAAYGAAVAQQLAGRNLSLMLEPGRSLVANAGGLLTRVEYLKPASQPQQPNFAVVDAAMNDLIRPALYEAYHEIVSCEEEGSAPVQSWNIVGPVCESGDFLGSGRDLALQDGALLCVGSAGAYGMVQASNYNSRGRAAEVLVEGDTFRLIRRREHIDDQLRLERDLHDAT